MRKEEDFGDLDLSLCLKCQETTSEALVENPKSLDKLLSTIDEYSQYGDPPNVKRSRQIEQYKSNFQFLTTTATYHLSCYKNITLKKNLECVKKRQAKLNAMVSSSSQDSQVESSPFTRSKTVPHHKYICFFCDEPGYIDKKMRLDDKPLFRLEKDTRVELLERAVKISKNEKLKVKLSSAVDNRDATAIDVTYHSHCWRNNVFHVLRREENKQVKTDEKVAEFSAKIEFIDTIQSMLSKGKVMAMSEIQDIYIKIRTGCNLKNPDVARKTVKDLLRLQFPHLIDFHKRKRVNESECVSFKVARDAAIHIVSGVERCNDDIYDEMDYIYKAAATIRKAILKYEKWEFNGSFNLERSVPEELSNFFRWVLAGPVTFYQDSKEEDVVNKAIRLSHSTIYETYTQKQVNRRDTNRFSVHRSFVMPQQVATGVLMRRKHRDEATINILHQQGASVHYKWLLRLENRIANTVLEKMITNQGYFVPDDFVKGRFTFFAADNIDFKEDTPDGKRTFHGTVMVMYQRKLSADPVVENMLSTNINETKLKKIPDTVIPLVECNLSNRKPWQPVFNEFKIGDKNEMLFQEHYPEIALFLAKSILRNPLDSKLELYGPEKILECLGGDHDAPIPITESSQVSCVPPWSGFNSLISSLTLPLTRISTLPLIAAPAHEYQTLLTVLKQAQGINVELMGPHKRTVITFDLGLYKPVKQLQMSRPDLDDIIVRAGELHIIKAMLITIGGFINGSGLDLSWDEADIFGSCTTKQILDGCHIRRGQNAHLVTMQSLLSLYCEEFFKKYRVLYTACNDLCHDLNQACIFGEQERIKSSWNKLLTGLERMKVYEKLTIFDKSQISRPVFKFLRTYMTMVSIMTSFVRSVRTGDWNLHLTSLKRFLKYYFSQNRLNYARLMPLYIAEMEKIEDTDPLIFNEFQSGNWVVNKNEVVPFCAIGVDTALENVNRSLKVNGGLVGITLSPSARNKFFLISPYLSRLAEEAKLLNSVSTDVRDKHHKLLPHVLRYEEDQVCRLTNTIRDMENPFSVETDNLFNIVTKKVVPQEIQADICHYSQIGDEAMQKFLHERIITNQVNLWSHLPRVKIHLWTDLSKKIKVKTKAEHEAQEFSADRAWFGRMLVVGKSRKEINLKSVLGLYELSIIPRSMFANDGTMLHCSCKSVLVDILEDYIPNESRINEVLEVLLEETLAEELENIAKSTFLEDIHNEQSFEFDHLQFEYMETDDSGQPEQLNTYKVALVDGMAEIQAFDIGDAQNCLQLANNFVFHIFRKYERYNEIRIIFDRYDVELSLKEMTRKNRLCGQIPVFYRITDTTPTAKMNMKTLISHSKTKDQLSVYLSEKLLEYGKHTNIPVIVAYRNICESNFRETANLYSSQEEADTKLILHAVEAAKSGATHLDIYSDDTDVLVLALRRVRMMTPHTRFVSKNRTIELNLLYHYLGSDLSAALPAFHAISGADITGSFSRKGKLTCWAAFTGCPKSVIEAFQQLGTTQFLTDNVMTGIEKYICKLYDLKTSLENVEELRWMMFKKKQAHSDELPPTKAALHQAVLRAQYQLIIWNNDIVANPDIPSPLNFGWYIDEDNSYSPIMTNNPPAPEAIMNLVKCKCAKSKCSKSSRCSCAKAIPSLPCTELCDCSPDCENKEIEQDSIMDEEEV